MPPKTIWNKWITPQQNDADKRFRERTLRLTLALFFIATITQFVIILSTPDIPNKRLITWIFYFVITIIASYLLSSGKVNISSAIIVGTVIISLGVLGLSQGYWSISIFTFLSVSFVFILLVIPSRYVLGLMTILIIEYATIAIWQHNTGQPYPNPLRSSTAFSSPTLAIFGMTFYLIALYALLFFLIHEFNNHYTNVQQLIKTLESQVKELQDNQLKLQNYADQEKHHAQQLSTLNEVSQAVLTLRDLSSVLEIIFEQTQQSLQLDAFFIGLYNEETNEISFPIMYDCGQRWHEPTTQAAPGDYIFRLVQTKEPFMIIRSREEVETPPENEEMVGDTSRKSASIMFAPLIVGERVIGGISAQSYVLNAYSEEDLVLLSGIGHQTAIAIENARLYSSIQRELAERKQAESALSAYAQDLEQSNAEKLKAQEALKAYAHELERSNQDLQNFAYIASHDLQEPLRKIQMISDRLTNKYTDKLDKRGLDYLTRMQNASSRMQTLIVDLLAFSRLSNEVNAFQPTDLNKIVQGTIDDLKLFINESGAKIIVDDLPIIEANPTQMQQLFQNLIQNGLKFRQKAHSLILNIECAHISQNEVSISISDNGIGFAPEYGEQIFGMFQRLHARSAYEGTGIGLAICQRIVEQHQGKISATGETNKGATFIILLPLKQSS